MTEALCTLTGPAITPEMQLLFGSYAADDKVKGIVATQTGIAVEYAQTQSIMWTGMLVGGDFHLLPDGRINFIAPQDGQPFAWAYRLPTDTKWSITTIDPATNHTAAWRAARIIQPLYTGQAR